MPKIISQELTDEERASLESALREASGKPKSVKAIANRLKRQRKVMNDRLVSWGEWSNKSPTRNPLSRLVDFGDEVVIATDGYDHSLISDFDSIMIEVNGLVSELSPIEKSLVLLEYQIMCNGRQRFWANKFGRAESSYKNVKARVLLRLSKKMGIN